MTTKLRIDMANHLIWRAVHPSKIEIFHTTHSSMYMLPLYMQRTPHPHHPLNWWWPKVVHILCSNGAHTSGVKDRIITSLAYAQKYSAQTWYCQAYLKPRLAQLDI